MCVLFRVRHWTRDGLPAERGGREAMVKRQDNFETHFESYREGRGNVSRDTGGGSSPGDSLRTAITWPCFSQDPCDALCIDQECFSSTLHPSCTDAQPPWDTAHSVVVADDKSIFGPGIKPARRTEATTTLPGLVYIYSQHEHLLLSLSQPSCPSVFSTSTCAFPRELCISPRSFTAKCSGLPRTRCPRLKGTD